MPRQDGARLPALDGVRGIAILTVLLGHLTDYGGMRPGVAIDRLYHHLAMLGGLGVDLFFVLSGFLITGILLDAKGKPSYFRNFYARRILRIFPLYYGFLFLIFVVFPWTGIASPTLLRTLPDQGWYWGYVANYHIAANGWPPYGGVGHFWSLAVEEQFYVVWPLLVWISGRRTFTALCGALVVAGPLVRASAWMAGLPPIANVATPARVDALALGALLAVLVRERDGVARLASWLRPLAVVATVALVGILVWTGGWEPANPVIPIGGRSLTIFASLGLIGIAIGSRPGSLVSRILANRVLAFYGVVSYGLYVFHPPLLLLLRDAGLSVRLLPTIGGSQLPGQLLVIVVGASLSTAVAYVSYRFFESPFLRLKAHFEVKHPSGSSNGSSADRRPGNPMALLERKEGDPDRRRVPRDSHA